MLKREITYEDFNGDTVTDIFYFNLSKPELIEMEVEEEGGFGSLLERIIESRNARELIKQFKNIVLMAYGVKSEDGKRFIKSDKLREEFAQTAAYQTLFMELASNDDAAAIFLKGVLPKDLAIDQDKPSSPPVAVVSDPTSPATPPAN